MPAWKKAGHPVLASVQSLKKLVGEASKTPDKPPFFVVIDLRSEDLIKQGFIPFATQMTGEEVVQRVPEFPKYKNVPIVMYTQDKVTPEALEALQQLVTWKYKSPAILDGGFEAWKASGGKIAMGEPARDIRFVKKIAKDEIAVAQFKELLKTQPGAVWIIDVRSPEEFNVGSVPGAKSFPLEKLQKDVSDLPKDKKLVLVCNTGAISSIANKLLEKKGFDTRYLNATIKYEDGEYEILE
jgi:rhodanese-related sulfurtransferase